MRHLLDHDLVDEGPDLGAVGRPALDRAAVHDDAGRQVALGREEAAERHLAVLPRGRVARRDVLDGELHVLQFATPALLQPLHGVEHPVVEPVAAAAPGRHLPGHQRPPQAAPVPVPPAPPAWGYLRRLRLLGGPSSHVTTVPTAATGPPLRSSCHPRDPRNDTLRHGEPACGARVRLLG